MELSRIMPSPEDASKPCVVFAAGGTGGHIVPALVVAKRLLSKFPETRTCFIGVGKPIEKKLVADKEGFPYTSIEFHPVVGKGILGLLKNLLAFPVSVMRTRKKFSEIKPSVVIGFGGYPCFIPTLTAFLSGLPVYLHEQNVKSGLANRLLSKISKKVFLQPDSDISLPERKAVRLNNPVREKFRDVSHWQVHSNPLKLLVLGGSQGSQSINQAIYQLLDLFQELGIDVVHQTGERNLESVRARYQDKGVKNVLCEAFFDDLPARIEKADLVIARAGAMTVAELGCSGRATIYIPLAISRAHQGDNVKSLQENEAVVVCADDENLTACLERELRRLDEDRSKIEQLSSNYRDSFRNVVELPEDVISKELMEAASQ